MRRLQRQAIALLAGAQRGLGLLASDELFFGRQACPAPTDALLQCVLARSECSAIASQARTCLRQPRFEIGGGDRPAEEVALGNVTAKAGQYVPVARSSMPSATTRSFSASARSMIARTMARALASVAIAWTKDWSIFSSSTGRFFREASDE